MQSNGSYGPCEEAEATGIAANSMPYHLEGRPNTGMEDLPTVSYLRVSAAKLVTEQEARLYALEGAMLAIMEVEMDVRVYPAPVSHGTHHGGAGNGLLPPVDHR